METLTYRRRNSKEKSVFVDSSSSGLSEVCDGDQIVKHSSGQLCIAVCLVANQKREKFPEVKGRNETLVSNHFFGSFPRGKRSKRRFKRNNEITAQNAEFHEDQLTKKSASRLCFPAGQDADQKKKRRQEDEETRLINEVEFIEVVIDQSLGREQSKRRVNRRKGNTSHQGKLDSNTFDCYLENLWSSFSEKKRSSFTYLDPLWFSMYTDEYFKAKVLNWIKKKSVFSKKYVFVPIVMWSHWSLLILCHFGGSPKLKSRTPCMLLLDSLQMANPERLEPLIRRFVLGIYKAEERPENEKQIYSIPLKVPKVPQQRNDVECGNFVLYYINLFIENAPKNFSLFKGYPYFMKEDWFTPEGLDCFCRRFDSFSSEN